MRKQLFPPSRPRDTGLTHKTPVRAGPAVRNALVAKREKNCLRVPSMHFLNDVTHPKDTTMPPQSSRELNTPGVTQTHPEVASSQPCDLTHVCAVAFGAAAAFYRLQFCTDLQEYWPSSPPCAGRGAGGSHSPRPHQRFRDHVTGVSYALACSRQLSGQLPL